MENKLQELTEKLYAEGIDKANQEADEIRRKAGEEAEEIKKQAKKDAESIVRDANKEAEEIKKNLESEIKLSSRQAVTALKQKINNLITARVIDKPVEEAFSDSEFIKESVVKAIENWKPDEGATADLTILLPGKTEEKLKSYFQSKENEILQKGFQVRFDDKLSSGFMIKPVEGGFKISFTDEDFKNFFKAYLKPRSSKYLYGDQK
ncbi:MAG: V-type ATP synthase subunit E [Bacteroidales bacterium]|nr:V-type ATP synthase subunit E [Bacteroidales bacterium]MCF8344945.1 V-type ATP synthase subunit E [Bacteroidales bacterium]MCF8352427.1 V-type ATP synthase subunit E [Bacteroidales bacterium]MCF8375332.1 V-type ATP synthase subunit E [Bacteroidales bacterium]MCF8400188.1 V-type ATP synthase subunit E [Bacteroidales bacterium]